VVKPELFQNGFLILRNFFAETTHAVKKFFHRACGLEEHEHLSFTFTRHRKRVRNFARGERRVARPGRERLPADARDEFAAQHMESLILRVMPVQRRTVLAVANRVVNTEVATGITHRAFSSKRPPMIRRASPVRSAPAPTSKPALARGKFEDDWARIAGAKTAAKSEACKNWRRFIGDGIGDELLSMRMRRHRLILCRET
jgi:hypothetical protein